MMKGSVPNAETVAENKEKYVELVQLYEEAVAKAQQDPNVGRLTHMEFMRDKFKSSTLEEAEKLKILSEDETKQRKNIDEYRGLDKRFQDKESEKPKPKVASEEEDVKEGVRLNAQWKKEKMEAYLRNPASGAARLAEEWEDKLVPYDLKDTTKREQAKGFAKKTGKLLEKSHKELPELVRVQMQRQSGIQPLSFSRQTWGETLRVTEHAYKKYKNGLEEAKKALTPFVAKQAQAMSSETRRLRALSSRLQEGKIKEDCQVVGESGPVKSYLSQYTFQRKALETVIATHARLANSHLEEERRLQAEQEAALAEKIKSLKISS